MNLFFSTLSYSFGNEDWKTEQQALQLKPEDHVLCITASGDRPLNLLYKECQRVTCIDANPIQNFLLQLKIAAMQSLNYVDYLSFLGAMPGKERRKTFERLLPNLDLKAGKFWQENFSLIEKGVLYQGGVERLTKIIARCLSLFRGKKLNRLFAIDNLEEQREFLKNEWNGYAWRKIFEISLNPIFSHFYSKDPGLSNVGAAIKPGTYFYERMNASLERGLAKNNLLLSLLFRGHVSEDAFPAYLLEDGTQKISPRLNRLEIHTLDIIDYLESLNTPCFDVFSLSDVISYLNPNQYIRLLRGMIKTAKPGARFCLRQFLSLHEIPSELQDHFIRNKSLENELEKNDNCFVYRFFAGHMNLDFANF